MPFLRVEKKNSGTYLRILESFRNAEGKSTHRILFSLGKVEDYTPEQLRRMGIKLFELGGGEVKALLHGDLEEIGRFNYGYQQIFGKALDHYGLPDIFRRIEKKNNLQFNLYDSIFLMLIAVNKKWPSLFNLDNHTVFNIVAYAIIFTMIYLFDRSEKNRTVFSHSNNTHFTSIE